MNQSEVRVQLQKAPRRSPASARPTDSGGKQHEKAGMLFCVNTRDLWIGVFIAKVNVKVLAAKSLSRQCHPLSLLVSAKNIKTQRTRSKLGCQARSEGLDLSPDDCITRPLLLETENPPPLPFPPPSPNPPFTLLTKHNALFPTSNHINYLIYFKWQK